MNSTGLSQDATDANEWLSDLDWGENDSFFTGESQASTGMNLAETRQDFLDSDDCFLESPQLSGEVILGQSTQGIVFESANTPQRTQEYNVKEGHNHETFSEGQLSIPTENEIDIREQPNNSNLQYTEIQTTNLREDDGLQRNTHADKTHDSNFNQGAAPSYAQNDTGIENVLLEASGQNASTLQQGEDANSLGQHGTAGDSGAVVNNMGPILQLPEHVPVDEGLGYVLNIQPDLSKQGIDDTYQLGGQPTAGQAHMSDKFSPTGSFFTPLDNVAACAQDGATYSRITSNSSGDMNDAHANMAHLKEGQGSIMLFSAEDVENLEMHRDATGGPLSSFRADNGMERSSMDMLSVGTNGLFSAPVEAQMQLQTNEASMVWRPLTTVEAWPVHNLSKMNTGSTGRPPPTPDHKKQLITGTKKGIMNAGKMDVARSWDLGQQAYDAGLTLSNDESLSNATDQVNSMFSPTTPYKSGTTTEESGVKGTGKKNSPGKKSIGRPKNRMSNAGNDKGNGCGKVSCVFHLI